MAAVTMGRVPKARPPVTSFDTWVVGGNTFHVNSGYDLVKAIGAGAYGFVCAARDQHTGDRVAIKKISQAFRHLTDAKRVLRELKILRHFHHENVISIRDILLPRSLSSFDDIYVVTDLMDTDLHQIIASPQPLSDDHVRYFLYQILRGLKCIHSAKVMHRDLKPGNLLVNSNCEIKICDFGLARVADPTKNFSGFMTEYVATRWYRAPEIILGWREYTQAVDLWSVGCIFAELLGRKVLFPGKDCVAQISLIFNVLGTPSEEDLVHIGSEKARRYIRSLPHSPGMSFAHCYPSASAEAIDLLTQLLRFDPNKRIDVYTALKHPYLAGLHDEADEPVAGEPFDFDFELKPTIDEVKQLVFNEVLLYHPNAMQEMHADNVVAPAGPYQGAAHADLGPMNGGPLSTPMADDDMDGGWIPEDMAT